MYCIIDSVISNRGEANMYIFKTSGETFDSVIRNQKHAFRTKPSELYPGELILVSKNKSDLAQNEKQIMYTMRFKDIRIATDEEIELFWPGNQGRWDYIIDCNDTKPVSIPFNLEDVLGYEARIYKPIVTFKKIESRHERLIIRHISES